MCKTLSMTLISTALLLGSVQIQARDVTHPGEEAPKRMELGPSNSSIPSIPSIPSNFQGCYALQVDSGSIYALKKNKIKRFCGEGGCQTIGRILNTVVNNGQEFVIDVDWTHYEVDGEVTPNNNTFIDHYGLVEDSTYKGRLGIKKLGDKIFITRKNNSDSYTRILKDNNTPIVIDDDIVTTEAKKIQCDDEPIRTK